MKSHPKPVLVLLTIAAVLLVAACGGDDESSSSTTAPTGAGDESTPSTEPAEEPAGETSGPGTYEWRNDDGAVIRYTIPAPDDHETVAAIRQFQADAGVDGEVTFVLAELDNTQGTEETLLYQPEVVTDDGETVTFDNAWLLVGEWQNDIDINEQTDLYERATELYNSMLNQDSALPGAKSTAVYAAAAELPSIQRVFISPGMEGAVQLQRVT